MGKPSFGSFVDEGVKLISYCPLCEASYNPKEASALKENDDGHLLHIVCSECECAILALVIVSSVGIASVGTVTDLSAEEAVAFQRNEAVTLDDVLAVHEKMGARQGEFLHLMMEKA